MNKIIYFLRKIWPFLITLILWRLSTSFWNPAGILALTTVFFYSFVKPIDWFPLFGLLICFLIDYRCNLPLFWTIMYCLFYAVNGFQNYIDTTHLSNNALYLFVGFIGFGFFILMFSVLTWAGVLNNLWLFMWLSILYVPITALDKWIRK
jgi:hypothetical protein